MYGPHLNSADIEDIKRGREQTDTTEPHIIDQLETFLNRFVAFPDPAQTTICAVWALHTFAFENAYATPYLYINSAEPQCGKTRLIETLMTVARNPDMAANLTASSLFRALEDTAAKPTLFVDEVDTIFVGKANEELRSVLNSGYKYNGKVRRTMPGKSEDSDVVSFSTFCPKVLAGIDNGQIPPTIADRCVPIILKRKRKDQDVERFLPRKVEPQAEVIKTRALEWVLANMDGIVAWDVPFIDELSDRQFEIIEPLMQIAMQAGKEYANRLRAAAIKLFTTGAAKPLTQGQKVLTAARDIMNSGDMPADKVQSATLAEALNVSPKQIGAWLAKYDITPNTLTFGGVRAKGYWRTQFEDAWERYI